MRWSRGWVANNAATLTLHLWSLHSRSHSGAHHALSLSSHWSRVVVLESFLELDSLNILLVFNFLLYVLVSLEQFVVLSLTQLQSLVQISLKLFLESIHFILLFLDQLSFSSDDLLWSLLHVFFTLFSLQVLASDLDLMRLLIPI